MAEFIVTVNSMIIPRLHLQVINEHATAPGPITTSTLTVCLYMSEANAYTHHQGSMIQ